MKRDHTGTPTLRRLGAAAAALVLLLTGGCSAKTADEKVSKSSFAFDTAITITVYGTEDETPINGCFDLCTYYDTLFSAQNEDSEIYKLNHREISEVSDETAELIRLGLQYSELSGGAFDIAVGSLTELWDFTSDNPTVPDADKIAEALKSVDYTSVTVDGNRVTFTNPDTKIDLGAVAKGYVADKLKAYLLANGVESAIINLGGNILCVGSKPDGTNFTVGIQYPFKSQSESITTLQAADMSVVTSGVYERYFEANGKFYHHILDPKTGYPFDNGLLSVSIIGPDSAECDCLSTTCFALGPDAGLALINQTEGYEAVFVTDDYQLVYSDGYTGTFVGQGS